MARTRTVVIDELHVTVRVPADLPDDEADAVRDTLASAAFAARLRRAVRDVFREFPEMKPARVSLTR